jgi:hypothetical protein
MVSYPAEVAMSAMVASLALREGLWILMLFAVVTLCSVMEDEERLRERNGEWKS